MEIINNHLNNQPTFEHEYDRREEAKAFEESKLGVKGLVDSGIARIPRIFHHPPETLFYYQQPLLPSSDDILDHDQVVNKIRDAATKFGFFQVINHGIPVTSLDRLLDAVKTAHELPGEEKRKQYRQDILASGPRFGFSSYRDLFEHMATSWCDTISARLSPDHVDPLDIPPVCR